ncbi:hypothetical protein EJ074_10805 [Mesorhizobium sp. M3A.F.Ca.ET.080.04.2.1]|nr:hypothetical protein EJ074_10805 [Mesorhizobium sp. M3A.F.Ca.ET.080.04.2.1]RWB66141.1 MAG: hypothetical protein EOQ49_29805 [Mesorhizobium sp.]RWB82004.1 MAG: hypothetical protein EOQ52_29085 [Mesorhizobium sp.]RWE38069.1 MAG: hypothetical protein EOS77_00150 [Mesorhizobium sp.]RWF23965.1 MAG: hypothetical protein EOS64_09370 [Mesorhizobium sp.]
MLNPQREPAGQRSRVSIDFAGISPRERYKLLIGSVVPRPIVSGWFANPFPSYSLVWSGEPNDQEED